VRTSTTEKIGICRIVKADEMQPSLRKQAGCGVRLVPKHRVASNADQADDLAPWLRVAV